MKIRGLNKSACPLIEEGLPYAYNIFCGVVRLFRNSWGCKMKKLT
jgi:hypothetical protein